jgi:hypothetical protein
MTFVGSYTTYIHHTNIYYIQASIFLSTATIVLSYYTFFSDYEVAPFITHSIKNLTSIFYQ